MLVIDLHALQPVDVLRLADPHQRRDVVRRLEGAIARRAPRGAGRGTAVVRLTVAANGTLAGVTLARSSGNLAIDRLALQAVRSAGRFPAAPAGLGAGPFSFSVPIQSR
ncbi:energy transducer TonB family protein [Mycolicibacterium poriferae]|uniref:energy transducer TonB family protein n=1 Tax=Mycolicibacterium poriferae TaxID=39694 RepID=UPI0024B9DAB5|nr:energy transducer TonB [Mycolicibacterium poriferae]